MYIHTYIRRYRGSLTCMKWASLLSFMSWGSKFLVSCHLSLDLQEAKPELRPGWGGLLGWGNWCRTLEGVCRPRRGGNKGCHSALWVSEGPLEAPWGPWWTAPDPGEWRVGWLSRAHWLRMPWTADACTSPLFLFTPGQFPWEQEEASTPSSGSDETGVEVGRHQRAGRCACCCRYRRVGQGDWGPCINPPAPPHIFVHERF